MNEIIVALDNMERSAALELARSIAGKVWGFKVNDLLYSNGIINSLKEYGNVFADPKLHDIPNTVYNSVKRLANAGADLITCHISGGVKMLQAANQAAGNAKIIGVTMLTSLNFDEIRQTYRGYPLERFSDIVGNSKIHGVVCAGHEIPFWSMLVDLVKVVPGVRPFGAVRGDDQARSCKMVRADYLVIGRPITQAENPIEALSKIKALYHGQVLSPVDEVMKEMRM